MNVLFKLEYQSTSSRTLRTNGAALNVLGETPQHIALALFMKDSAVSASSKVERLVKTGLITKSDRFCIRHLQEASLEIFIHMHDQILDARYFPRGEVVIQTFNAENLAPLPLQKPADVERRKLIPNQRVDRMIQEVKVASQIRSRGFSIMQVNSRTNGSFARDFVHRVDGASCAVVYMYAVYTTSGDLGSPPEEKKAHVAIKIPYESGKRSDDHLRHEAAVLKRLNQNHVPHVQQLWDQGIFELQGGIVLITKDLRCGDDHNSMLNCINLHDFLSICLSLVSALNGMHESDMTHGSINMKAVYFNFVTKEASLGDMKYAELDGSCPPEFASMKTNKAVTLDDSRFRVIDCQDQEKKKKDWTDLGLVEDGYEKFTSGNFLGAPFPEVVQEVCNRFNHFVCDLSLRVFTQDPATAAIEALLTGASSLVQVKQLLHSAAASAQSENLETLEELVVGARFVKNEHEMMYPVSLKPVECVDNKGKKSHGYGAFALVDMKEGDLVAEYTACTVPSPLAETLRENHKGCHFKTTGPTRTKIFYGARQENGINDIVYMSQNGQVASMIQGSYEVKVVPHPTDHTLNRVYVRRKRANCRFHAQTWQSERLSYYPGNPERTEVILVYATDFVKKGDQFLIDYGDQSAKEFFGVESILGTDEPWPTQENETSRYSGCKRTRIQD